MLRELHTGKQKNFPVLQEIEFCYHVVWKYWNIIREKYACYQFESVEEEIHFFRVYKPKFLSEISFYELLNHLELFSPHCKESYRTLLLREQTRLERFAWNNREFFEYYKSGQSHNDQNYFLRTQKPATNEAKLSCYCDENTDTSYDYVVAQIIALERYDKILKKRLQDLEIKNS